MGFGGCTQSRTYDLTIACPTITVNPATLPNATVSTAYGQTITASPVGGNYTFAVTSGLLPAGLTLNSNGSFSGAPTQSGTFNFRITATGFGDCTNFRDYVLTVDFPTITVNPSSLSGGTVGTAYNQSVSASPAGTYSYAVSSGALPLGLTLNAATGAITGTPTTTGSINFTITATAGSCTGSRSYTVTIACATITLSPASPLPAGQAGVAYSQTISPSPAGSYTISITLGSLPSGLTLHPTTGVLSGTPVTTGSFTFTIGAQAGSGCQGSQSYTLAVGCPTITVNPATLPNGSTGAAYNLTVSASPAGGSYTYAASGNLPPGLNLNAATGALTGTPTANGSFTFTMTATGFGGCTGNRQYTVLIGGGGCPTVTLPASLPNGSVGQLYSNSVAASPAGSYVYSATGTLPPGVTLFAEIGLLFGYPVAAGSYTFTITATQGACSGSQEYTVLIGAGFASSLTAFSDFDGDGKGDLSVFRGSDGKWLSVNSSNGQIASYFWGLPTDIPVPGDYDADGKTDVAVWRASDGAWYIVRSLDSGVQGILWGDAATGDVPVPGDYDGDGKTDVIVFRRSGPQAGQWLIKRSSDDETVNVKLGVGTDVPVPGDFPIPARRN